MDNTSTSKSKNWQLQAPAAEKSPFTPQPDWVMISQGAEARIWKIPPSSESSLSSESFANTTTTMIIAKERFSKAYRHPTLDEKLTKARCKAEGRILDKCRNHHQSSSNVVDAHDDDGQCIFIDVPKVIRSEPPVLYLEYIEGMTVREYLEEHLLVATAANNDEMSESTAQLARQMGSMIGKLHTIGCIHGDLTTSNMMLRHQHQQQQQGPDTKRAKPNDDTTTTTHGSTSNRGLLKLAFIDFGLAKNTTSAEERAVDLYVLERALTSTHPNLPTPTFFDTLLDAYKASLDHKAEATIQRLDQVRLRGRKRECFG